ncbi:MAG: glycosyltransferase [Nitrospirae bacterium]|nr:glycosyltransferase [Nitrospirota bacterium]
MINILYLFVTLPVGGAEEHLLTILRNLNPEEYRPTVLCIRDKGEIGREIEGMGIDVISLNRDSKAADVRIIKDILKVMRKQNISLVHTHLYHANMYGRTAAFLAEVPVVSTEHNAYPKYKFKRRIVNWLLAKRTGKIVAVSDAVKNHIVARDWITPTKVEVIHNAVDISRFDSVTRETSRQKLCIAPESLVIGTVGRLIEQKGHIYLIEALHAVREAVPQIKLVLAGSGTLETSLKNEVSAKGLDEHVMFLGQRRDIPDILKAMDIFVLPSLWEGLPMVLLEAMASGLPIVATSVSGVTEIVRDEINGIIVPARNKTALAGAIIGLSADSVKRKAFGRSGRKMVEDRFSSVRMAARLDSVYKSLIQNS